MDPIQKNVGPKNHNASKLFQFLFAKKQMLIFICMTIFCASPKNMLQSNAKTISKQCHYDADELKAQIKRLFWIWKENSKCCHLYHGIK